MALMFAPFEARHVSRFSFSKAHFRSVSPAELGSPVSPDMMKEVG